MPLVFSLHTLLSKHDNFCAHLDPIGKINDVLVGKPREARVNGVRIARAGTERYLAVDKRRAKAMRETLIKETLPDRSARTAASGAMACRRASAAAASKTAGLTPWTVSGAPLRGRSRMRRK